MTWQRIPGWPAKHSPRCRNGAPAGSDERVRLFATVLLHDVAKPDCTQHEPDGRITAPGHSRRGESIARRVLWELGAPMAWREHVAALIRHHQVPFWALERPDLERIVFRASLVASNADLAILATADILGRTCSDADEVLENIALFREFCADLNCLDGPRAFPSDHARFRYFRTPGRDPNYAAHDDTRLTATVLSGLPGAGKDTWIAANRPGEPVVSLDAVRAELGVDPAGDQRAVVDAAYQRAREHLRAGRSFVWNATNISRSCASGASAWSPTTTVGSIWSRSRPHRRRCAGAIEPGRHRCRRPCSTA